MDPLRVGVIGCGRISGRYIENLTDRFSRCIDVRACADILPDAAQAQAEMYAVPTACSPEELLADPEIELVVNLTTPVAHHQVSRAALMSGKHVYTEKPLGITRAEGRDLLETARAKGLRIGGAPDTFLGAGLQTCRKLLDDGWLGQPVTATAFIGMSSQSARYHTRGIGPVYDMAPYYLTALVHLLGPVARVTGSAKTPFAEKGDWASDALFYGSRYPVETPTTVCGVLEFRSGANAVITATCDSFGYIPRLELFGTEGILLANDPNMFHGPVRLRRREGETQEMPLTHGYAENSRGLGVADMAYAIRGERPHRASAELIYHVLDVMVAIHEASERGVALAIESSVERPTALRAGLLGDAVGEWA